VIVANPYRDKRINNRELNEAKRGPDGRGGFSENSILKHITHQSFKN
jgi:hypothetical protein